VHSCPVAKLFVGSFNDLFQDLLGTLETLLLDFLETLFVKLELMVEGRIDRVRRYFTAPACT
jgi:hypothetical protein